MVDTRERSFWAWGEASRFPDEERRRALSSQTRALLGLEEAPPLPLPSLETAQLPETKLSLPSAMRDFCSTERVQRIRHTYGRAYPDLVRGFRGDFSAAPDAV